MMEWMHHQQGLNRMPYQDPVPAELLEVMPQFPEAEDGDSVTEAARQYGVLDTRRCPVTTASTCTAIQQPRNEMMGKIERKRKPAIVLQMLPTHVPAVSSSPHGVSVSLSDAGQSALVGLRVGLPLEQQE
jgi:hypothetical protein